MDVDVYQHSILVLVWLHSHVWLQILFGHTTVHALDVTYIVQAKHPTGN